MKTFKLFTQQNKITGPDILGAGAARKELAAIVRVEKIYAKDISGGRVSVHWSGDRLGCVIKYRHGFDSYHVDYVWDCFLMKEKRGN